ncbi:nucleotidyltransferase family protein [Jatrophihabitans sp. DSM 45814]
MAGTTTAAAYSALDALVSMTATNDLEVSRGRLARVDADRVPSLIRTARAHGMEAWLAAVAPSATGPWADLAIQRARFLAAGSRTRATVRAISSQLAEQGHAWALLKGLSIAESSYPRSDLRHSLDIDVLVDRTAFKAVLDLLVTKGYLLLDVNWPLIAELEPGQLRLRAPNGTLIDLHWSLFNQRPLRRYFRLPAEVLLSRTRTLGDDLIPVLDPVDLTTHIGVHAALGGAAKLSWLVDIDGFVRQHKLDWQQLIDVAVASGAAPALAISFSRAQMVLDTPIPENVMRKLAGGRFRLATTRAVLQRSRIPEDPEQPSFARAYARSARNSMPASALELVRHGSGWLGSKLARSNDHQSWLDPTNHTSALFPVPDEDARHAYFTAIVRDHG